MNTNQREVIVVGGGISGLTTAWHLKRTGVDVCLLEAEPDVGGCIRTQRRGGFLLEKGPFNVIVRDPAFEDLLNDVAGEVEVIGASRAARRRYIYHRGRLHTVPTNPVALATKGLLSIGGRCRLLAGLLASSRLRDAGETIEQAAIRRFGRQVSDILVSAAISGILAGDIRKLSLRACFPSVARVDASTRSPIGFGLAAGLRLLLGKRKGKRRRRWRGLGSIDGGRGALTDALGRRLGSDLLSNHRVNGIRRVRGGYEVECGDREGSTRRVCCHQLVIASSISEVGRLLQPLLPRVTPIARAIESASLVVLNLGYRRADIGHPLDGFGFLVPHSETDFPLMGVLWADSIFSHHAPPQHRLIRVFIGGARDPDAVRRSDTDLLEAATSALRDLLQLSAAPVLVDICRHPAAIPQYHAGHCEKIERLRAAVATQPGLHLVGNYLKGVSLNDCIRLAAGVAGEVAAARRDLGTAGARVPRPVCPPVLASG